MDIWAGPGGCSWPGLPPYYHVTAPWQLLQPVPHNKLVAEIIQLLIVWQFYLLILKDNFFHFPSPVSDISAPPFKYSVKGVPVRSHIVRRIASGLLLVSWWWPRKIKRRKLRRWKTTNTFILFCCYWKQKTGSHRNLWELWAQMPLKHTQFQAPGLIWELKSSNL